MKHFLSLLALWLCSQSSAWALTADIVVAPDGTGDFTKIQDAINAVPSNQKDRRTVIYLKNGLYRHYRTFRLSCTSFLQPLYFKS